MPKIRIDPTLCKKCSNCVEICPENVFAHGEKDSIPKVVRQKACISCGHCVGTCPSGAIMHEDFGQHVSDV